MGLLGDVFSIGSAIAGKSGTKKSNKIAKKQLEFQKQQAAKGNEAGDYLFELARALSGRNSNFSDAFGGGVQYNPETGQYEVILSPEEQAIQEASYREELARNTEDQAIRRAGLRDAERMRVQASGESDQALRDAAAFRSGVGQVDESKLASQLLANRTGAINAGYDDAARAASRIGLRSGTSAGDALSEIARNRTRDIASMGDPVLDALQASQSINSSRNADRMNAYNMYNNRASAVNDANFNPSGYNAQGTSNLFSAQANDLNWRDLQGSLAGGAAGAYGGVATGVNNANRQFTSTYNPYGTAQMLKGLGNAAGGILSSIATLGAGGGGFGGSGASGGF